MSYNLNEEVEDFNINPENGECETKSSSPFVFSGKFVCYNVIDRSKVGDKEQRRDDDRNNGKNERYPEVAENARDKRSCEGNKVTNVSL